MSLSIEVERPISHIQKVYVDIMTIEGIDFIVAVSKPMNITTAEELLKTHAEMIYSVVKNVIDKYYTFSYKVGIMI